MECNPIKNTLCGNFTYFAIYNIIYIIYIEKKIKGILFRPDSNNDIVPMPSSLMNFLSQPLNFKNPIVFREFWKISNWDMNYLVITAASWSIKGMMLGAYDYFSTS
jgi:hypothetical protein